MALEPISLRRSKASSRTAQRKWMIIVGIMFILLAVIWIRLTVMFLFFHNDNSLKALSSSTTLETSKFSRIHNHSGKNNKPFIPVLSNSNNISKMTLLSRDSSVIVTSDVRGNLGPPSVLIQNPPGKNWIKDRWQAAGDMHGTAIPGQHWVILDFGADRFIQVSKVILDWEAAYANDYLIQGASSSLSSTEWCILFDAKEEKQKSFKSAKEFGQSPGVKEKTPLHVVHTIDFGTAANWCPSMRYLRVFIKKPARGWGVSLWQVDVYGLE